jgi:hypothetical protein
MDVALAQEERGTKCNEFGTVVVQITVNRNGNMHNTREQQIRIRLVEPALATARKYRWQPDADAPETQIGFITVNFKLENNLF